MTKWTPRGAIAPRLAAIGLTAGLVAAPTLAAAPVAHAEEAPNLKLAIVADIDTFNPFKTILASSINVNRMVYESLVEYGPKKNELVGGLAEKWEVTPDGKTWTFTLPDGRTWSDGTPITAEDPAWTVNQVLTNKDLATANGSLVENVESATAKDKNTFVVVMKNPQASNPGTELPIVPKHVWEKVDASKYPADGSDGKPVVGSGPFVISKYAKGQSVELKPNAKFHRGAPKVSGLTWVYYKNTDAAVQGLRAGELDLVSGLTTAQFNSLKGQPNIATANGKGRRYQALAINPGTIDDTGKPMGDGNPALQDPKLREAIFTAVDNNVLLTRVLGGLGQPGRTQVPSVYPDYFGLAPGTPERKFDPAAANKILDDAGYAKGANGIRNDKQGKPLKLRLMGRNSDATHQQLADFVKPWMKDIGIEVDTMMVSSTQVNNDSTLGKYDLYFTGWGIGPDPDFQLSINQCSSRPKADGSGNTSENNWCSPEFDELYKQQHSELDPAKRQALVKQAYSVLYRANVLNVLYYADTLEAYRSDRFASFQKQPEDGGVITGQNSYWGLYSATPVKAAGQNATEGKDSGGLPTGAWVAIAAALAVAIGGGAYAATKKKKKNEDRE
ncbi:ABC transporter substrate-binding protein [Mariniluteicoccus flavus]